MNTGSGNKSITQLLTLTGILVCLFVLPDISYSQVDSISLQYNEILITRDTFYLGTMDSIVAVPAKSKYKIKKNRDIHSKAFYDSIAAKTKGRDHLNSLYKSILVQEEKRILQESPDFEKAHNEFKEFEGKIIRSINFHAVDLFEGNVLDTSIQAQTGLGKFMNKAHYSTHERVLRKNLRIKEGMPLESARVSENERLLRGLSYLQDAKFIVQPVSSNSDSVDILIVTQDNFPWGFGAEILDYDHFVLEPYHRNVLGTGDEVSVSMIYKGRRDPPFGYGAKYTSTNIGGSLTDGSLEYQKKEQEELKRITFRRPFRTSDMVFGGEIDYYQHSNIKHWRIIEPDTIINRKAYFKKNFTDSWIAKSVFMQQGAYHKKINLSYRLRAENYLRNPVTHPDSNFAFHDNITHLGSITFQNIRYYKSTKILSMGVTEDVPYGMRLNLTVGYQKTEFYERPYFGAIYSAATHRNKLGYGLFNIGIGGYYRDKQYEDLELDVNIVHISELYEKGRYAIRNTFAIDFITVGHLLYYDQINFDKKIRGLKQSSLFGQSIFTVRNDFRVYTPWSFLGFKIALGIYEDIGWISSRELLRDKKDFYASIGAGIHIKNESLTIPTFTTRLSYYPNWTEGGSKLGVTFIFSDYRIFRMQTQPKPFVIGGYY